MPSEERELARVRHSILGLAGAAWLFLIAATPSHGSPSSHASMPMMSTPALVADWLIMVAAMMAPTLTMPVWHVWRSSLARRRTRSIALFASGYLTVWLGVGAMLLAIAQRTAYLGIAATPVALTLLGAAFVWHMSPVKQHALNRCHARPALAAFGASADRDAIGFGVAQGIWCAASCWALMALVATTPRWHMPMMIVATVIIIGERLERPRPAAWAWRGLGTIARLASFNARALAINFWSDGAEERA